MMESLEQALRRVAQERWQGRRCYATNMAQTQRAIRTLHAVIGPIQIATATLHPDYLKNATAVWYREGLSPATINKRLNCLSALGVNVEGCRVREPKVLKWWLRPEDEERLVEWLRGTPVEYRFGAFIVWTTRTGLRIEESLRLTWGDISAEVDAVTVPGLKTATAQATLPLGQDAREILMALRPAWSRDHAKHSVFGLTYEEARVLWEACRVHLGVSDNPTATLKALRRSAARHLHVTKGMPLDMVRQYLRHEDIETTMGYLRLTGGYGTEEMRKWL